MRSYFEEKLTDKEFLSLQSVEDLSDTVIGLMLIIEKLESKIKCAREVAYREAASRMKFANNDMGK
jgi:hypothetical protein